jgi:ribosome-dependent ATPase
MHAGQVLVSDTPAGLTEKRGVESLEDAFVGYLEEAAGRGPVAEPAPTAKRTVPVEPATAERLPSGRNAQGWVQRSTQVELCLARGSGAEPRPDTPDAGVARQRDPDVHHGLRHHHGCGKPDLAVLDRDQTTVSRDHVLNLAGSRYRRLPTATKGMSSRVIA